jgi:hypothetical protein
MPHNDRRYNRDDDQKAGSPPRPATEPKGSEGSSCSDKTLSDPATGVPNAKPPKPA